MPTRNQARFSHYADMADRGQVIVEKAFSSKHRVERAFSATIKGVKGDVGGNTQGLGRIVKWIMHFHKNVVWSMRSKRHFL